MKVRVHVFITGRVQGVFFRSEVRHKAKKNGLAGWVRNLPDGRVEAVFEGEETRVNELVDFCRIGPPGARVSDLSVTRETCIGELQDFEVRNGSGY